MITFLGNRIHCLALAMVLAGCVGAGSVPEQRFYRLPDPEPAPLTTPLITAPLGIPRLQANGLYHERAILHYLPARPLDLRPYHYHFWNDSPTLLIRDHLADYLQAAGAAKQVVPYQDEGRAKLQLRGRLIRFEREVSHERIAVHVELEFTLDEGREQILPARRYDVQLPVADRTLHTTIETFGEALETIYRQLLEDLSRAQR